MKLYRPPIVFIVLFFCLSFFAVTVSAKVNPAAYGITQLADSATIGRLVRFKTDSLLQRHPMLAQKNVIHALQQPHGFVDKTTDFYLILFLFFMLGLIRMSNPRYFQALLKAFSSPGMSNRQVKEQIEHAELPNFLMNIFFGIVTGGYLYYVINIFVPLKRSHLPQSILLGLLITGVLLIYLVKYLVIRFSGWVFRVEGVTDEYIFNVFLINKIISIALLPFIVILAFGNPTWLGTLVIFTFILIGLLWINRYMRSWQIFGSFFQYSKFHFFTYLCASELLPLAVLLKLMVRGLLYY